jgi:chromosome segregation ATPase
MNFEEKLDAMRMNLELAFHDIEALRTSIEAQKASIEAQRVSFEAERESIRELRIASAHQHETAQVLMKATENLLAMAHQHDQRITGLERRA